MPRVSWPRPGGKAYFTPCTRNFCRNRGAEIIFADLRLDPVSHKWRSGNKIELTAKEYGLLEYMVRHPNTELTRAMVAENCWDYGIDFSLHYGLI